MHSRIIQLERELEKIEESPMTEDTIVGDWDGPYFIGTVADYVSDNVDREDDINWLKSYLEDLNTEDNIVIEFNKDEITFKKGFKQAYFKDQFESFKREVREMELENFINPFEVYSLKMRIEDTCSFYIYYSNGILNTLDKFVRYLPDEDVKYYIGTTLDYHC